MNETVPYSAGELAEALADAGVAAGARLLVAVSGGADSMALALLSAQINDIVAATVDHGLRPAAADEARQVSAWMAAHDIAHQTLKWDGDKPAGNIQAEARIARYRLLDQAARDTGCDYILTAHHQDDQAETFLVRLARGSGLKGLAGMSGVADVPGVKGSPVRLVRPMLDVPRERLELALEALGQGWINDPSNDDHRFSRVQARALLADPPLENLSAGRIAAASRSLRRAADALVWYEQQLFENAVQVDKYGIVRIDLAALRNAPEETSLRLLSRLIAWAGGADYPPRFEKLQALHADLATDMPARTLGGVVIEGQDGLVVIRREPAAASQSVNSDEIFDGRWRLSDAVKPLESGYLGQAATPGLKEDRPENDLPWTLRQSLGVVWQEGEAAIPLVDGENASLLPVFPQIVEKAL